LSYAQAGSVRFQKSAPIRTVYLTILRTHTVRAAAVAPMALVTLTRPVRGRFESHRAVDEGNFHCPAGGLSRILRSGLV